MIGRITEYLTVTGFRVSPIVGLVHPPFTLTIEAREGVTTGISAADRARTIQVAIDPSSTPEDLVQPGHVFPLTAKDGWTPPRDAKAYAEYAQKWLKEQAGTYRIEKFTTEKNK